MRRPDSCHRKRGDDGGFLVGQVRYSRKQTSFPRSQLAFQSLIQFMIHISYQSPLNTTFRYFVLHRRRRRAGRVTLEASPISKTFRIRNDERMCKMWLAESDFPAVPIMMQAGRDLQISMARN